MSVLKLEEIKQLETIYYLDRNPWNVNDPQALIVEMEIYEEDGKWYAYAEQGHLTLQFELKPDFLEQVTEGEVKYLFKSRKEARAHYDQELQAEIQAIHSTPKTKLLQMFYQQWAGQESRDIRITEAMKAKILNEFGVYIM